MADRASPSLEARARPRTSSAGVDADQGRGEGVHDWALGAAAPERSLRSSRSDCNFASESLCQREWSLAEAHHSTLFASGVMATKDPSSVSPSSTEKRLPRGAGSHRAPRNRGSQREFTTQFLTEKAT
jgi:hypothetical protein